MLSSRSPRTPAVVAHGCFRSAQRPARECTDVQNITAGKKQPRIVTATLRPGLRFPNQPIAIPRSVRAVYQETHILETGSGGLHATYRSALHEFHGRISAFAGANGLAAAMSRHGPRVRAAVAAGTGGEGACRQVNRRDVPGLRMRGVLFRASRQTFASRVVCSQCGASNWQRQMAYALRTELGLPIVGRLTLPDRCRLYSAEANGPLHAALTDAPGYVCSEIGAKRWCLLPASHDAGARATRFSRTANSPNSRR